MANSFQDFPCMLKHPAHKAAIPYKQPRYAPGSEGWGKPIEPGQTGKPEMFPDVMVRNWDQELEYASKGYVRVGVADPEAYHRAVNRLDETPPGQFEDYPRMLYRYALNQSTGENVDEKVVQNKEEEEKFAKLGWFRTPGEAIDAHEGKKPSAKSVAGCPAGVEPEEWAEILKMRAKKAKDKPDAEASTEKPPKMAKPRKPKKKMREWTDEQKEAARQRGKALAEKRWAGKRQQAPAA